MKIKKYRSILVSLVLIIGILSMSSCSLLSDIDNCLPSIMMCSEFENDDWIVVGNLLVNKENSTVTVLKYSTYELVDEILFYYYTYKVDFEETCFKVYTYCRNHSSPNKYYDCVCTYNYHGQEIAFDFLSDEMSEEQAMSLLGTRLIKEAFVYSIDDYTKYSEYHTFDDSMFFEHVESIYNYEYEKNDIERVRGVARTIGNEIWFSIMLFPSHHSFLNGVKKSEIKAYNTENGEFKNIYVHNKKREAVIDFDENGIYTIHNDGSLCYYDINTGASTAIYSISSGQSYLLKISDNYICVKYKDEKDGWYYLVYKKQKGIVANSLFAKDEMFGYYEN